MYVFINNNNTYIYDLYANLHILVLQYGGGSRLSTKRIRHDGQKVCKLYLYFVVFVATHLHLSSLSSVDKVSWQQKGGWQSVPVTKWLGMTCPTMKWLATNCTYDEMAGDKMEDDEVSQQWNGWRWNDRDETPATNGGDGCTLLHSLQRQFVRHSLLPPVPFVQEATGSWIASFAPQCATNAVKHNTFTVPVAQRATTSDIHRSHTSIHKTHKVYLCRNVISW